MQRFLEYSSKNIDLSYVIVPFPFPFVLFLEKMQCFVFSQEAQLDSTWQTGPSLSVSSCKEL